jgi:hypothetical protein
VPSPSPAASAPRAPRYRLLCQPPTRIDAEPDPIAAVVATVTGSACSQTAPQTAELSAKWKGASLHEIKVKTLEGKDADLKDYAGKVTLVVNVASQCGLTGQYAGLQKIYDKYKAQGFEIPGEQWPAEADQIVECLRPEGLGLVLAAALRERRRSHRNERKRTATAALSAGRFEGGL